MLISFNSSIDVVYVHGVVFPAIRGVRRVLFSSLRDGDVTVWYQSKGCNNGPLWAMKDAMTKAGFLSAQQRSEWMTENLQKCV